MSSGIEPTTQDPAPRLSFDIYELDLSAYELIRDGEAVATQPKTLDLLIYLARHRDRVVSREELFQEVWDGVMVSDSALSYAINMVRRAVGDDGGGQAVIATVRGRGYRFVADARVMVRTAPHAGRSVATLPFVGGETMLSLLQSEFAASRKGRGRAVLLAGEPGIGKSRTLAEFTARAQTTGAVVLAGRCVEGDGAPAFWPWLQILRSALQKGLLGERHADSLAVVARVLPELRGDLDFPLPPHFEAPSVEPTRFRIFELIEELLRDVADNHPLIITIDDLHKADQLSLRLLEYMLRSPEPRSVFLAGTYRDTELHRGSPESQLLASVSRAPGLIHAQVPALSKEQVGNLLEAATGETPDVDWLTSVHERTGGNPFFLAQMVQLWGSEGSSRPVAGALPPLVQEAIRQHLDGLPDDCRHLLEWASVFGREFDIGILAAAVDRTMEKVSDGLEPAVAGRVLHPIPGMATRYQFAHALIQETLYDSLPTAERLDAHDRVAHALEYDGRDDRRRVVELANHAYRAAPRGGWERAVRCCEAAARNAMQQLAWEDAAGDYERALDSFAVGASTDVERRLELILALATARFRSGELDLGRRAAAQAAEIAREHGMAAWLARAALAINGDYYVREGVNNSDQTRVHLLQEAIDALGPGEGALHARLCAALSDSLIFEDESERMHALGRQAIEIARGLDDPDTLAFVLKARHITLRTPEFHEERCEISRELGGMARGMHDPRVRSEIQSFRLIDALEAGDIEVVDECLEDVELLAEQTREPFYLWFAGLYNAMRSLMAGREDAEARIETAYELGMRSRGDAAELVKVYQLHLLRVDQGRAEEMLEPMGKMSERFPFLPVRIGYIWLQALCGDMTSARREIDRSMEYGIDSIPRDMLWIDYVTALGELASMLEDRTAAQAIYEKLHGLAPLHVISGPAFCYRGCVAHTLGKLAGLLDRWREASQHFETALLRQRDMGAWPATANTHIAWAKMLLREGAPESLERAQTHIDEAISLSRVLGLRRFKTLAQDLLPRS